MLKRFLADQNGSTSIEYAMIGALVSIVIVAALLQIGGKLNLKFVSLNDGLK